MRICFRPDAASGPSIFLSATREIDHEVWRSAKVQGREYVLQAPLTDEMVTGAVRLAVIALRGAGVGPLEVFAARQKQPCSASAGAAPEADDVDAQEATDIEESAADPVCQRRPVIGVYIPADPHKRPKQVTVDGSNATTFLHARLGRPSGVRRHQLPEHRDHALYVNSRYMQLPESKVNLRASMLLEHSVPTWSAGLFAAMPY